MVLAALLVLEDFIKVKEYVGANYDPAMLDPGSSSSCNRSFHDRGVRLSHRELTQIRDGPRTEALLSDEIGLAYG